MPKYKFGKQKRELSKEEFWRFVEKGNFVKRRHKAFFVLIYYTGARKAELLELTKDKFQIDPEFLRVDVKAKKQGIERAAFKLRRDLPYVELIVKAVEKTRGNKRVFPFDQTTAWRIVKRVSPKHYPHFFRLNRCVKFLNNPEITLNEIRQWFAWKSLKSVESYLGYSRGTIEKLSSHVE